MKKVKQHPFFWANANKFEFICKVSERIRKVSDRDQDELNFVIEFTIVTTQNLCGLSWYQSLPQRPQWGSGNQKTPQDQCCRSGTDGFSIGLLRFIRNVWTHRVQSIRDGHWISEVEIMNVFFQSYPWLVTELYQLCERYFGGELESWVQNYCL